MARLQRHAPQQLVTCSPTGPPGSFMTAPSPTSAWTAPGEPASSDFLGLDSGTRAVVLLAREGFTDFDGRPRRLQLFLAEYGWTGQTSAFSRGRRGRDPCPHHQPARAGGARPAVPRIVTQGGADAFDAALAELAHFT